VDNCVSNHLNLWNWNGCLQVEKHQRKRSCCKRGFCLGCPCESDACSERHRNGGARLGRNPRGESEPTEGSEMAKNATRIQASRESKSNLEFNEGPQKRARAVDFPAVGNLLNVKLPVSHDSRKGVFSEEVLVNGSEKTNKVAYNIAETFMDGVASSVCDENPVIIKSWVANKCVSQGLPLFSDTKFDELTKLLAKLATRADDESSRRTLLAALYHAVPQKTVYTL